MPYGARGYGARAYGDASLGAVFLATSQSISSADTGSAVEGQLLTATFTKAETGSAVEGQLLTATFTRAETASGAEGEVLLVREALAFAYIYSSIETDAQTEGVAAAYFFENIVSTIPTPHVWYIVPASGHRGDVVTVVGIGFGATAQTFEGLVTVGDISPAIEDWRSVVPGGNDLSSNRVIDTLNDTVDPGHDRIDFRIPNNAVSSDVKIYLNAPDVPIP